MKENIGRIILWFCWVFLIGIIVMGLWNWLIPFIFQLPEINLWQSLGMLVMIPMIVNGIKIKFELPKIKEK